MSNKIQFLKFDSKMQSSKSKEDFKKKNDKQNFEM